MLGVFVIGNWAYMVLMVSSSMVGEVEEFEDGKKTGRHLVIKLKEEGVIFKGSDGVFYYDKLRDILEKVGFLGACYDLLQRKGNTWH